MKTIAVEFTNEQAEVLNYISKMCKKNTPDFIKEALVCLLPLDELIAAKRNLIVIQNENNYCEDQKAIQRIRKDIHNVHASTNHRLKRIGML